MQIGALKIVRGQGVARKNGMHIAVCDQLGHCRACVMVKGEGRAHDPDDLAMIALIAQQIVNFVVIAGEGRFTGTILAEGERLLLGRFLAEAVCMDINALGAILRPTDDDKVALLQQTELAHDDPPALIDRDAVHAALLGQTPGALQLEILREDAHGVVALRGDAVHGRRKAARLGRGLEFLGGKVRRKVGP